MFQLSGKEDDMSMKTGCMEAGTDLNVVNGRPAAEFEASGMKPRKPSCASAVRAR
jgi:hypothetical protein